MEDLAYAYWRLTKWVDNADVDHKMAANSALRQIKKYLDSNNIEVIDYYGQKYDSGFSIDVIGRKSGEDLPEEDLIIVETIRPIILENGEVVKYGQVMLGVQPNEDIKESSYGAGKAKTLFKHIDSYLRSAESNSNTSRILIKAKKRIAWQYKMRKEK